LWKAKGCYDMFWLVMACCGWPKGLLLLDVWQNHPIYTSSSTTIPI
jgi:hypothetical protein